MARLTNARGALKGWFPTPGVALGVEYTNGNLNFTRYEHNCFGISVKGSPSRPAADQ